MPKGQYPRRYRDLKGRRFGRLKVLRPAPRRGGLLCWLCRCACGRELAVRACNLQSGNSRSCGCAQARPPNPARTARLVAKARALRAKGLTLARIGERLGVSHQYVHYLLHGRLRKRKGKG
jgi:hypothetical protein